MEDRVKTSFIPKASLNTKQQKSPKSNTTLNVFNLLGVVILVAAIVVSIGVFLLEQFTIQSIENKKESLERARAAFQPATIKELSRLDSRLQVGSQLLSSHIAPSKLFDVIEEETLSSVRFRDFSMSEAGAGRLAITMGGEAQSFNAVALQSDRFGANDLFSEVIFSNLNIDASGNVVFNFSAAVDKDEILYLGTPRTEPQTQQETQEEPGEEPNNNQPQL